MSVPEGWEPHPYSGSVRYFTPEQGPPQGEPMKLLDSGGSRILWDGDGWRPLDLPASEKSEPWPPEWAPAGYVFYEALPVRILSPETQRRWKENYPDV